MLRLKNPSLSISNASDQRSAASKKIDEFFTRGDEPCPKPSEPRESEQFRFDCSEQSLDYEQTCRINGDNHSSARDPMTAAGNGYGGELQWFYNSRWNQQKYQ